MNYRLMNMKKLRNFLCYSLALSIFISYLGCAIPFNLKKPVKVNRGYVLGTDFLQEGQQVHLGELVGHLDTIPEAKEPLKKFRIFRTLAFISIGVGSGVSLCGIYCDLNNKVKLPIYWAGLGTVIFVPQFFMVNAGLWLADAVDIHNSKVGGGGQGEHTLRFFPAYTYSRYDGNQFLALMGVDL